MAAPRIPAWTGPLDVEGLAMDAAAETAAAVRGLAAARGARVRVDAVPSLVEASFAAIERLRVDGRATEPWSALSGFVATADGWVRLHGNYPHHATAIRTALHLDDGPAARPALLRACRSLPARAVCERILARGGVAAVVRGEHDWHGHPQELATAGEPWLSVEPGAPRGPGQAVREPRRPLSGLRVLDLTRVVAGPMCTQLLACLGADVLRLDPPGMPEQLDAYLAAGMGKRSAVRDLSACAAETEDLLAGADVVVLGYRPGSLDRHGLAPDRLLARHPQLVVATLSAWGERGPWGEREGFDSIVQAATGIATLCRAGDGGPGALPVQALDHATGLRLASGILDLLARGVGGRVRASLLGASRALRDRPRPRASTTPVGDARPLPPGPDLPAATPGWGPLTLTTPHGRVQTVPPPLLIEGDVLQAAIGGYGAGSCAGCPKQRTGPRTAPRPGRAGRRE